MFKVYLVSGELYSSV